MPYCLLKFFFSLPPICSHSLPSALPLNSSERYNNKNTVEWRRSRWQSRRMWSSPPPTEHIKNTSACGAILTADKLKTVGKTYTTSSEDTSTRNYVGREESICAPGRSGITQAWRSSLKSEWFEPHTDCPSPGVQFLEDESPLLV